MVTDQQPGEQASGDLGSGEWLEQHGDVERPDDLLPEDPRRDDDVVADPNDLDDALDGIDAGERSYDDLDARAHAIIGREHATDSPELQPDDASVAVQAQSPPRGPDADERPV